MKVSEHLATGGDEGGDIGQKTAVPEAVSSGGCLSFERSSRSFAY